MSNQVVFDDMTVKHLEFIQAVVGRLASNAFLMKGWALTVSVALFGFAAKDLNWRIAIVGLVPVLAFWGLDAYFLSRERMFRALYDAVRIGDPTVEAFSMDYRRFGKGTNEASNAWVACLRSKTIAIFYLPVLAIGAVLIVYTAGRH